MQGVPDDEMWSCDKVRKNFHFVPEVSLTSHAVGTVCNDLLNGNMTDTVSDW